MRNGYRRPLFWMLGYIGVIVAFAVVYYLLPQECWGSAGKINSCIDALYFSVVTITSLGFGDIYPVASSATRLVVCLESLLGIFIIGFFLNDVAMSQAKALNKKEKDKEEKQKRDTATHKIRLWQSELEPVFTMFLAGAYEVTTPFIERKYPNDFLNYEFQFKFSDMHGLYEHSRLMANDFNEPVVFIHFRNEEKLYDALVSFLSNADLSYWPELEKNIYHFLRLHQGFHFKEVIKSNLKVTLSKDQMLKDILTKMIKETEGEPQYKESNLINSYIALYYSLKEQISTIQQIYSMMDDILHSDDELNIER